MLFTDALLSTDHGWQRITSLPANLHYVYGMLKDCKTRSLSTIHSVCISLLDIDMRRFMEMQ